MATIDKNIELTLCPLCGTHKEEDILLAESIELAPKFSCGTVVRSFHAEVKTRGEKCRVIQKIRNTNPPQKSAFQAALEILLAA